jgi:DNA-binding IclR family transcriptional regulator
MANRRVDDIAEDLAAVVDFVRQSTSGARSGEIAAALKGVPQRTLQRWLKSLVESGRLVQGGKGPAARYRLPAIVEGMRTAKHTVDSVRPQVIGGWECVLLPMRPV